MEKGNGDIGLGGVNYLGEGKKSKATRGRVSIKLTLVYVGQNEGGDLCSPVDDGIIGTL